LRHLKSFSVYAFTIFFNAAISFLTVSLLTHHLSEVDYGIINLYSSALIFLSPFIGVGVQFILGVDFFKMNEIEFRSHFTNAIVTPVVACILFSVIALVFHSYIESTLHVTLLFALLLPLACLVTIFSDVILTLMRDKGLHKLFSFYSIFKNLLEVGLTILLVIVIGLNWQGRIASNLITLGAVSVIVVIIIRRWHLFTGKFEKNDIGKSLYTGLPFVPERLAIFILGYSDRFFINHYSGTGDVGYYSAGAQIAIIMNLSTLTLSNVFYPSIYRTLSGKLIDYSKVRKIVFVYLGISGIIAVLVILAIPYFFQYFIGPKFLQGEKYAILLTIGLFFWAVYNVFIAFLLNIRRNRVIMGISICGMIVSIVLNFFLVKNLGAIGATYTSIAAYFSMAGITIFFVHKYYGLSKLFLNEKNTKLRHLLFKKYDL